GQLSKGQKASGIMLVAYDEPPVVVQPGDRSLHLPPGPITLQRSAVLNRGPLATLPVGTDEFNPIRCQTLPQRIRVRRPVVASRWGTTGSALVNLSIVRPT